MSNTSSTTPRSVESASSTHFVNEAPAEVPAALKEELLSYIESEVERRVEDQLDAALERAKKEWATEPPLWSPQQVANYLNIGLRTLEKEIAAGKLQPTWVRGQRRFHRKNVKAYLRSNNR